MILVTGGAGFIGSSLVASLVERGIETVALDDLSGGSADNLPAGASLVEADVSNPGVARVVADLGPEAVVHAAAQVSVAASVEDPARDREVNVEGTENVIRGAKMAGVGRFVFLSSGGAVYGDCDGASEETLPRPASYYGAHKYLAERYLELSGLSYATARLANVYGPGQRAGLEGGVVAVFLKSLLEDTGITINGTGEQRRDFVYVGDVVEAAISLLDTSLDGVWNVGTGHSASILELLETLTKLTNLTIPTHETGARPTPPEVTHAPPRPGDVQNSRLLVDRLAEDTGYKPRHTLPNGLEKTLRSATPSR